MHWEFLAPEDGLRQTAPLKSMVVLVGKDLQILLNVSKIKHFNLLLCLASTLPGDSLQHTPTAWELSLASLKKDLKQSWWKAMLSVLERPEHWFIVHVNAEILVLLGGC